MRFAIGIDYDGSNYRGWQTQQEGVPPRITAPKAIMAS